MHLPERLPRLSILCHQHLLHHIPITNHRIKISRRLRRLKPSHQLARQNHRRSIPAPCRAYLERHPSNLQTNPLIGVMNHGQHTSTRHIHIPTCKLHPRRPRRRRGLCIPLPHKYPTPNHISSLQTIHKLSLR